MAYIVEIQNFSDPALDVYARLTENQLKNRLHPEGGLFIAESPLALRFNEAAPPKPQTAVPSTISIEPMTLIIVCPAV